MLKLLRPDLIKVTDETRLNRLLWGGFHLFITCPMLGKTEGERQRKREKRENASQSPMADIEDGGRRPQNSKKGCEQNMGRIITLYSKEMRFLSFKVQT